MSNTFAGTSRVFVGNLAYTCTEESLHEAFKTVGPVLSARLVFDKDTGKMKGFGFVEYQDYETAQSAVRNLNGYMLDGRPVRVDMAEPEKNPPRKGGGGAAGAVLPRGAQGGGPSGLPRDANGLPTNLPTGIPLPPGMSATDSISQTLATLPPEQLLDILAQMKSLVTTSPDQARALLNAQPQLAYALFQAMVLMKVVDPLIVQRMLAPSLGAPQPAAVPVQPPQYPHQPPQASYPSYNQPAFDQPGPSYGNPAPPMAAPPAAAPPAIDPQQQAALLQQVLAMTQAQIDALPPKDRETVMALRAQLAGLQR